jgi:ribonuclease
MIMTTTKTTMTTMKTTMSITNMMKRSGDGFPSIFARLLLAAVHFNGFLAPKSFTVGVRRVQDYHYAADIGKIVGILKGETSARLFYPKRDGRRFSNRGGRLPVIPSSSSYREYTIPMDRGYKPPAGYGKRGLRRLVVECDSLGSPRRSADHYRTFVQLADVI